MGNCNKFLVNASQWLDESICWRFIYSLNLLENVAFSCFYHINESIFFLLVKLWKFSKFKLIRNLVSLCSRIMARQKCLQFGSRPVDLKKKDLEPLFFVHFNALIVVINSINSNKLIERKLKINHHPIELYSVASCLLLLEILIASNRQVINSDKLFVIPWLNERDPRGDFFFIIIGERKNLAQLRAFPLIEQCKTEKLN